MATASLCNYVAYVDPTTGAPRVGHMDLDARTIQPLSFGSGTPIADLYQVIEAGPAAAAAIVAAAGVAPFAAATVTVLPPLAGRDVLAVGKNYLAHAREFNQSGFDSSDRTDRPSHAVIFTKRATAIVADGVAIEAHDGGFTATLDYEGEIGVIIGRAARGVVTDEEAWACVWGFTIVNDVTARERQRDHKQFFLGKSADTFCPMGPVAVPRAALAGGGRTLAIETHVNGELRQRATTDDLIFSIPDLLRTISTGQTLQPGDVLATGTPAGVGIGRTPPVYLKPGDEVAVSVPGLGTLRNTVVASSTPLTPPTPPALLPTAPSAFSATNGGRSLGGAVGLTDVGGGKMLHCRRLGTTDAPQPVVFVHGLGGTLDFWTPLVASLHEDSRYALHLFDLEGHGLSPTHPLHAVSIASLAADVAGVCRRVAGVSAARPAVLVAHSMGCLAALRFAVAQPALVRQLVLLGPPASPLPVAAAAGMAARAALVRQAGMGAVVDAAVGGSTSAHTQATNPLAVAAVRLSLLAQDPEAYAKACQALARSAAETLAVEAVAAPTLLVAGADDAITPPALCAEYASRMQNATVTVLPRTGHYHVFEDPEGVAKAVHTFLRG